MPSCVVCGRSRNSKSKSLGITFHRLPSGPVQAEWIAFAFECGIHANMLKPLHSLFCSEHFNNNCFEKYVRTTLLKPDSVPSIMVQRIKCAKVLYPEKAVSVAMDLNNTSTNDTQDDIGVQVLSSNDSINHNCDPFTSSPGVSVEFITPQKVSDKSVNSEIWGPDQDDTPKRSLLKRTVSKLIVNDAVKSKKLKYLRQKVKRQAKKIASMKMVISSLKQNNLLNDDELELFTEQFGKHNDLIKRYVKKGKGQKIPKKYSPELRKFAITLHFHSAKAYNFVRKEFNTIIPHPRTLSKWYSHTKAEPGFTEETIKILTLRVKNSDHTIYCGLIIDEISIRHHVEWDGNKYHGYVNFGAGFNNDKSDIATECFVFMLVAINESWKIPVGYFLCNHLNSSQKSELTLQCLNLISKTGIKVVSLTFDGCASNINMSKLLGCNLDPTSFKTNFEFKLTDSLTQNIAIFPDPAHMIKLVRNTFGEKKIIIDGDNNIIKFDYLEKLLILQESEGLHLANKLKKQHISFFKQKMKVKLATQLLSKSVADALEFCKNVLCLDDFQSCEPTIKFIRIFNDAFDILNSRNLNGYGKKKALCSQNFKDFLVFKTHFYEYVLNLKFSCGTSLVSSNRKTGFLGFMICFESLLFLHNELIVTSCLKFIPCYKISQDHIELFFGAIRSHQGHNNNPTARQFKAAYLKLLIHAEIKQGGVGNCIPLEDVDILISSSVCQKEPENIINETSINYFSGITLEPESYFLKDHDYIFDNSLSMFTREIVIYLSGFIVHKLRSKIKCDVCISALHGDKNNFLKSLIDLKDNGGLTYPSADVINICIQTEKNIRSYEIDSLKKLNKLFIQNKTLQFFINDTTIFESIKFHNENDPLQNHVILLIKSVISSYYDIKIHHLCKKQNEKESLRTWYNKLVLFKGQ